MKIEKFASKMDLLGVLAFLYVIIYAILALLREVDLMNLILLIIGTGGFLVDLFVTIKTRLK
ncbi:MAG: hypothetical protein Q8N63_01810 [Nanoarchaeota archaeon]|nr:hypothetical protein [Nanoarchaeota archaeon]